MVQKSAYTDTEAHAHANECVSASSGPCNEVNIFLGLIEYELNSLLGHLHLVGYISVHIRFGLERYLLIIVYLLAQYELSCNLIGSLDAYYQRLLYLIRNSCNLIGRVHTNILYV